MTKAEKIISTMSLEQKVGQLFVLAFPGKKSELCSEIINTYGLGGCYISQDNASSFEEARRLSSALQKKALEHNKDLPLLLGVDQEGAWGVLVPESTIGPGNLALGVSSNTKNTYDMYSVFAQEMASVGYGVIFGPCSDVNLNPQNPIIGTRSFGEDPKKVAQHVKAAVEALKDNGVFATAKHFPGHGDTHNDTHRDIPIVNKSMETLLQNELLPFQTAIDVGVDIIMTSHILYPQIDPTYPATLSSKILTDLLRKKMNFTGLIITDSMNMGAMRKNYSPEEASVKALMAGADLIMLSEEHYEHSKDYLKKQIASIQAIVKAVKQGEISEDVLHNRLLRVVNNKLRFCENKIPYTLTQEQKTRIEKNATENAICVLKNENNLYPIKKTQSVLVVNATPKVVYKNLVNVRGIGPNQKKPAFESFAEEFRVLKKHSEISFYEDYNDKLVNNYDIIIVVTEDYPLPGEDFEKTQQQNFVKKMISLYKHKLIVVGLRSPYELEMYKNLGCYICTFSSRTCSAKAVAEFLVRV